MRLPTDRQDFCSCDLRHMSLSHFHHVCLAGNKYDQWTGRRRRAPCRAAPLSACHATPSRDQSVARLAPSAPLRGRFYRTGSLLSPLVTNVPRGFYWAWGGYSLPIVSYISGRRGSVSVRRRCYATERRAQGVSRRAPSLRPAAVYSTGGTGDTREKSCHVVWFSAIVESIVARS